MSIPQDVHQTLEQEPDWVIRRAMAEPAKAAWRVSVWYLLLCVLPFACAAFLPWRLMPDIGGPEDFEGPALVGFLLWGLGLFVGAIGGAVLFHPYRKTHLAYAQEWNALAWLLAVVVFLVGCVGMLMVMAAGMASYA